MPIPLQVGRFHKHDLRTQFSALPFRVVQDKPQVLLITSRRSRRWIVPKGWPMPGKSPAECAAIEAYQEAGVKGKVYDLCLGVFSYTKEFDKGDDLPCAAMVYPIKVKRLMVDYPEKNERKRKWFSLKKAARRVAEPELAAILTNFDPKILR
ncbi:MAG: NUDIX hydrolase [Pseudomonadota bacterium]